MPRDAAVPLELSDLELQALRLTVEGASPAEITRILVVQDGTVRKALGRVRQKLGATTNEQAVILVSRYHRRLLKDCVVSHGSSRAVEWHETHQIPLCPPCMAYSKDVPEATAPKVRKPHAPYRRLTPVEQSLNHRKGDPVDCGTIQAARRHIRKGERISDATCGCKEAYAEWWREYNANRKAG